MYEEVDGEQYLGLFRIERSVGASHISRVYEALQVTTGRQVALKVIIKLGGEPSVMERDKMVSLSNSHLVQLSDIFEDQNMIIIMMDCVTGGELLEWIVSHPGITESGVARLVAHILTGLKALHDQDIVHRNIKPENILVSETDIGAVVKLTDFCLGKVIDGNAQLLAVSKSEVCMAPEVLRGEEYDKSADMWSVGVIAYMILSGRPPITIDGKDPMFENLKYDKKIKLDGPEWECISDEGREFVEQLLALEPDERMTVENALEHPWLTMIGDDKPLVDSMKLLQRTSLGRKLKRVVGASKTAIGFKQFTRMTRWQD